MMTNKHFAIWIAFVAMAAASAHAEIEVVGRPDITRTNSFYVTNRAPLVVAALLAL